MREFTNTIYRVTFGKLLYNLFFRCYFSILKLFNDIPIQFFTYPKVLLKVYLQNYYEYFFPFFLPTLTIPEISCKK